MEQSAELEALYVKICDAQTNGDYGFFQGCFSREDGTVAIGTDPEEWWLGYDSITRVFQAQLEETAGFTIFPDTPQAYCTGTTGWIAGRPMVRLSDGTEIPMRLTVVLQKEQGDWKIVHWHSSVGINNEVLIGEILTT